MAKVLCVGCPFNPPVIHGFTFEPHEDGVHYVAEVPESAHGKFFIGEDGSPFFLEAPKSSGGTDKAPGGGGAQTPGGDQNDAPGGAQGGTATDPAPDPMDEFRKLRAKVDVAALAKERLGLDLDPEAKMDVLLSAVDAEFKARAAAAAAGTQQ